MRLEEIGAARKDQHNQAEGMALSAEEHRQHVETLQALREQLGRLEQELTSSDIEQAQAELEHSQTAVETERNRLEAQKRALIRENLKLTARCDTALEKAKEGLKAGGFVKEFGRYVAIGTVKFGLGVVTGLVTGKTDVADNWVDKRLGRVIEATQKHVDQLEKTREQLLETRKLLEESGGL